MKLRRRKEEVHDNIDISPLIDMVFILLIFFMVSTTFVKDMKIDINRPEAQSQEMSEDKSIRVQLDTAKTIYVNGQEVSSWVLQSHLRPLLRESEEKSVLVIVDAQVSADELIEVVDQCRLAGATDVGVATQSEVGA